MSQTATKRRPQVLWDRLRRTLRFQTKTELSIGVGLLLILIATNVAILRGQESSPETTKQPLGMSLSERQAEAEIEQAKKKRPLQKRAYPAADPFNRNPVQPTNKLEPTERPSPQRQPLGMSPSERESDSDPNNLRKNRQSFKPNAPPSAPPNGYSVDSPGNFDPAETAGSRRQPLGLAPSERDSEPQTGVTERRRLLQTIPYHTSEPPVRNSVRSTTNLDPTDPPARPRMPLGSSLSERQSEVEIPVPKGMRQPQWVDSSAPEPPSRNAATSQPNSDSTSNPRSNRLGLSPSERLADAEAAAIPKRRLPAQPVQLPPPAEPLDPNSVPLPDFPPAQDADVLPLTQFISTDLRPREMSLREAIQISLMKSDVVRTVSSTSTGGSQLVNVEQATLYDPAILREKWGVSATVFDPKISAGYIGSRINEPSGTFFGPGIAQQVRRDEGNFVASLSKQFVTGATASIGYLPPLGYLFYPNGDPGVFNPVYTSDLVAQVNQPLLKGAGIEFNLAPIKIAQLKADQSAWDVKAAAMAQVRSVEVSYWDLQASLITLNATESVMSLMSEIVRIEGLRADQELSTAADVARVTMQFDQVQQQQIQARNDALGKELKFRNLLAIEMVDGTRIVPIDPPVDKELTVEHAGAVASAIENRPDLIKQRIGVRIRELELLVARNGVNPQLDLQYLYRSNGIGQTLNTSLQQMVGFAYADYTAGITFSVPIGNRAAKGNLRAAEFQLTRDRAVLDQSIQNVSFTLADMIRESGTAWAQYQLALRRVRNSREWIKAAKLRYSTPPPNSGSDPTQNWLLLAMYDYQNALKMHVDAISDAGQAQSKYKTQLVRLQEAQGTLLEDRGIDLEDDPCRFVKLNCDHLFGKPIAAEGPGVRNLPYRTPGARPAPIAPPIPPPGADGPVPKPGSPASGAPVTAKAPDSSQATRYKVAFPLPGYSLDTSQSDSPAIK